MDLDHSSRRFVEFPDRPGYHPLFDTETRDPKPEPLGTFWRRSRFQPTHGPAGADEVRPIQIECAAVH